MFSHFCVRLYIWSVNPNLSWVKTTIFPSNYIYNRCFCDEPVFSGKLQCSLVKPNNVLEKTESIDSILLCLKPFQVWINFFHHDLSSSLGMAKAPLLLLISRIFSGIRDLPPPSQVLRKAPTGDRRQHPHGQPMTKVRVEWETKDCYVHVMYII